MIFIVRTFTVFQIVRLVQKLHIHSLHGRKCTLRTSIIYAVIDLKIVGLRTYNKVYYHYFICGPFIAIAPSRQIAAGIFNQTKQRVGGMQYLSVFANLFRAHDTLLLPFRRLPSTLQCLEAEDYMLDRLLDFALQKKSFTYLFAYLI